MKSILKIAGLCLASMLVLGMAIANTALATHWLVCLPENTGTTTTKWNSSQCTTAGGSGGWEWSEIKGTEPARVVNQTLTLKDTDVKGSESVIQCAAGSGEGEGAVGPGGNSRINTAKVKEPKTECKRVTGACEAGKVETVEGINLPWQTESYETEGKLLFSLLSTIAGKGAGWKVRCKSAGVPITDECESESGKLEHLLALNVATGTELLVLGTFERTGKAKCTLGGAETGVVEGSVAVLVVGRGLRLSK